MYVTYEAMFAFAMLICTIISLVIEIYNHRNK